MRLPFSPKHGVFMLLMSLAPGAGLADPFDVTMTVVGPGERFDESVVNRIALPFASLPQGPAESRPTEAPMMPVDRLPELWREETSVGAPDLHERAIPPLDTGWR